jgi:hypothetical protein
VSSLFLGRLENRGMKLAWRDIWLEELKKFPLRINALATNEKALGRRALDLRNSRPELQ